MKQEEFGFASSTGVCTITCRRYLPDGENVKAVFVIHHGMAEHQARYAGFIEYLTSNGYAVYMHDMANHGISNQKESELGFFGEKDGDKNLVKDLKHIVDTARSAYPDKKIIVMGHSMGSFVVRCFTAEYPNAGFDAAIYMGTGGSNPVAPVGQALASAVGKIKGIKHKSKTLDKITFGSYNDKFEKRTSYDWLTRDNAIVDAYIKDPLCGFLFTVQGMKDLIKLNVAANGKGWYDSVPKQLPILLISGAMDPVGGYGKGIKEVYGKLRETGHTDVTIKLYDGARHEVLNETNKADVYKYILDYADKIAAR